MMQEPSYGLVVVLVEVWEDLVLCFIEGGGRIIPRQLLNSAVHNVEGSLPIERFTKAVMITIYRISA